MLVSSLVIGVWAERYLEKTQKQFDEIYHRREVLSKNATSKEYAKDLRSYRLQQWFLGLFDLLTKQVIHLDFKSRIRFFIGSVSDSVFALARDLIAYSVLIGMLYQDNEENGVEISGGEAQKIAIARALYKDSPIIILDEPTAALDPKSEAEIYDDFAGLIKGKTAIFISHRMSSTRDSDAIAVIADGVVKELGNHKDLMKNPNGLYHQMWDAQAQYYR